MTWGQVLGFSRCRLRGARRLIRRLQTRPVRARIRSLEGTTLPCRRRLVQLQDDWKEKNNYAVFVIGKLAVTGAASGPPTLLFFKAKGEPDEGKVFFAGGAVHKKTRFGKNTKDNVISEPFFTRVMSTTCGLSVGFAGYLRVMDGVHMVTDFVWPEPSPRLHMGQGSDQQELFVLGQLIYILMALKKQRIVHRDLKPPNFVLKQDCVALFNAHVSIQALVEGGCFFTLIDYGLSCRKDLEVGEKPTATRNKTASRSAGRDEEKPTASRAKPSTEIRLRVGEHQVSCVDDSYLLGTLGYVAPDLRVHQEEPLIWDYKDDTYAMGAVAVVLFTGNWAPADRVNRRQYDRFRDALEASWEVAANSSGKVDEELEQNGVSESARNIIAKMINIEVTQRSNAEELWLLIPGSIRKQIRTFSADILRARGDRQEWI